MQDVQTSKISVGRIGDTSMVAFGDALRHIVLHDEVGRPAEAPDASSPFRQPRKQTDLSGIGLRHSRFAMCMWHGAKRQAHGK